MTIELPYGAKMIDPQDFVEDDHTSQEIADFYNEQSYTPDDLDVTVDKLPNGDWVPSVSPALCKNLYWSNAEHKWLVFPSKYSL